MRKFELLTKNLIETNQQALALGLRLLGLLRLKEMVGSEKMDS